MAAANGTSASGASVHTIHLEGHETQHKLISQGGFGDEEIFSGNLNKTAGNFGQVGIFVGTLTSVGSVPPLNMATVDLQLKGGQISVQGFFDSSKSPSCTRSLEELASIAAREAGSPLPSPPAACSTSPSRCCGDTEIVGCRSVMRSRSRELGC